MKQNFGPQVYPLVFTDKIAVTTTDLTKMQAKMAQLFGWNCKYDAIGDKRDFLCRVASINVGGLTVVNTASTSVLTDVEASKPSLFIPVYGPKLVTNVNGSATSYDPESHALYAPKGRRIAKNGIRSSIILEIDQERLQRTIDVMSGGAASFDLNVPHILPLRSGSTNFVQLISGLCRTLEDVSGDAITMKMLALDETFYRVAATMFMGPDPTVGAPQDRSGKSSVLDTVCQFARQNLEQRITLTDLEAISGASSRRLQYEFIKKVGCSPMAWLRKERLNRARSILSKPNDDVNITVTASSLGFSNLGTFSRYYREEYGELPSETLSRSLRR